MASQETTISLESPSRVIPPAPLKALAAELRRAFALEEDELAILGRSPASDEFELLWPRQVVHSVPPQAPDSLAARTARAARPYLNNRFGVARHASLFEALGLSGERRQQPMLIAKILMAPLTTEGETRALVVLMRRKRPSQAIGADFSPADLVLLEEIAPRLLACLEHGFA